MSSYLDLLLCKQDSFAKDYDLNEDRYQLGDTRGNSSGPAHKQKKRGNMGYCLVPQIVHREHERQRNSEANHYRPIYVLSKNSKVTQLTSL